MTNEDNDVEPRWNSQLGAVWVRRSERANSADAAAAWAKLGQRRVYRNGDRRRSHTEDDGPELGGSWLLERQQRQVLFEKPAASNVGDLIEFVARAPHGRS